MWDLVFTLTFNLNSDLYAPLLSRSLEGSLLPFVYPVMVVVVGQWVEMTRWMRPNFDAVGRGSRNGTSTTHRHQNQHSTSTILCDLKAWMITHKQKSCPGVPAT